MERSTMLLIGKPSKKKGHGFHGELLNNQRLFLNKNMILRNNMIVNDVGQLRQLLTKNMIFTKNIILQPYFPGGHVSCRARIFTRLQKFIWSFPNIS